MDDDRRARREAVVRTHMESENRLAFDETIATFSHPRYELVASGDVYDGEEAVRAYFRDGRAQVPDQRNELIAMHHADDAVITEFWLRGTPQGFGGRTFECRMTAFFVFDDSDRIVTERVYWDRQTIFEQIGLI